MMADLDRTEKETQREAGHESKRLEPVRAGNALLLEFSLEVGRLATSQSWFRGRGHQSCFLRVEVQNVCL